MCTLPKCVCRYNADLVVVVTMRPSSVASVAGYAIAVQRDAEREERSTCAASLLERAVAEAVALRQEWLVVPRLPSQLQVQGANWLAAAGFDPEGEDTPADVRRAMSAGAVCRKVVGRPSV